MIFKRRSLVSLLVAVLVGGCGLLPAPASGSTPPAGTEVFVSLPEPTGTPTFDWFPASPTSSPLPYATQTATPEMRPGVGQASLSDSFTDGDLWDTAASDQGTASVDRGRLTLVVQPEVYLFSLRRGLALDDFYAEVTAHLNLCRGTDDYGLLIRASRAAYFRFSLNCDGMLQADRVSAGTRQSLQRAILSGDAPRGAPGEVRIGVWASGSQMRLFLNGRYQFTINHPAPRSGTIGVFARSAGDTPLSVNFSDLVIQDVTYSPPTRTPAP